MTTSPSPARASASSSNGASPSSLPRWRQFLSTLNWRPVREIELEIEQIKQRSQRSQRNESEAEQRMKLIDNEILRVRHDSEQRRIQHELRMKRLESEIEQLRRENARERALSALIKQHCFPPECSSTLPQPTELDCGPSSP